MSAAQTRVKVAANVTTYITALAASVQRDMKGTPAN